MASRTTKTAKTATLMTREEKALVRASESKSLAKIGEAVLRTQIERARHLRKKYDDLLQRQRAEAQSQGVPRTSRAAKGNAKTLLKVDAFTEAVTLLERESDRRAGKIVPAAGKAATKSSKKSAKKASRSASGAPARGPEQTARRGSRAAAANGTIDPKKSGPKTVATEMPRGKDQSGDLRAKQNTLRQQRGPAQRQLGHAAARGRRQQARSDARN